MIKFTEQEYFEKTGTDLSSVLEKDPDSKQAKRFIDYNCRVIDNYIRKFNPNIFKWGYDKLSNFQVETIKQAAMEYTLFVYNVGSTYIDENGLPKKIPISEDVKDILRPLLYRGI